MRSGCIGENAGIHCGRAAAAGAQRSTGQQRGPAGGGNWTLGALRPSCGPGRRAPFWRARWTGRQEIALAVHPDRYIIIESDRAQGLTFAIATGDPIAADLIVLALRQGWARFRGAGPWEDPLVQAATELNLGARTYDQIDLDAVISPTLSSDQRERGCRAIAGCRRIDWRRTRRIALHLF